MQALWWGMQVSWQPSQSQGQTPIPALMFQNLLFQEPAQKLKEVG